jgi:hypothetical protein
MWIHLNKTTIIGFKVNRKKLLSIALVDSVDSNSNTKTTLMPCLNRVCWLSSYTRIISLNKNYDPSINPFGSFSD